MACRGLLVPPRGPILQRGRPSGAPYHTSAPEIEAQRVAPVRTFRYRPLPVDVIRLSPATYASRSRDAPAPAPPAPPRQFPHEQLEHIRIGAQPCVLGEELLSRYAGHALDEGADRATAGDASHAVDEELPRLRVLVELDDVVYDSLRVLFVYEHIGRARVPLRVHGPLGVQVVEAERDDPIRIPLEDRLVLGINDADHECVGGDAVVPRPLQHG